MAKYAQMKKISVSSSTSFKTIGEVSSELNIPQHVLRFWESKFNVIKPLKRKGGHRHYSPKDVAAIKKISSLLYDEGFTIKGAQKFLIKNKKSSYPLENAQSPITQNNMETEQVQQLQPSMFDAPNNYGDKKEVENFIKELESVKDMLEAN